MFKLIAVLIAAGAVFMFTPMGKDFQDKAISIVNPASVEQRSLDDVKKNLNSISKTINAAGSNNLSDSQRAVIKNALSGAQSSLADAQSQIENSNIAASISSLISKVIPHDTPSPSACPTP